MFYIYFVYFMAFFMAALIQPLIISTYFSYQACGIRSLSLTATIDSKQEEIKKRHITVPICTKVICFLMHFPLENTYLDDLNARWLVTRAQTTIRYVIVAFSGYVRKAASSRCRATRRSATRRDAASRIPRGWWWERVYKRDNIMSSGICRR